jgi:hypothetical protein
MDRALKQTTFTDDSDISVNPAEAHARYQSKLHGQPSLAKQFAPGLVELDVRRMFREPALVRAALSCPYDLRLVLPLEVPTAGGPGATLSVDESSGRVEYEGRGWVCPKPTLRPFQLLVALARASGRELGFDEVGLQVWGKPLDRRHRNLVNVTASKLRKDLRAAGPSFARIAPRIRVGKSGVSLRL